MLVVEDGDEYLTNLSTFVARGFRYRQAHSGAAACTKVVERAPDLVYLDMRFDRTPEDELLGNMVELVARFNGDVGELGGSSRTTRACSCCGRCGRPAFGAR